jgi:hypothetical protein
VVGPTGPTGATGTTYVWEGPWATSTAYDLYDTVQNDGSGYVCTSAHTSGATTEPGVGASWTDKWDLFVEGTNKTMPTGDIVGTTDTQTLTNKTLTSPIINGVLSGWTGVNDTWTYASATTITVPSGAASKYQKGDWIRITQTTDKYFKILAVADTVLTVTAGTTHTVADATITNPCYSHMENPLGVPRYFSWTPVWSLTSGTLTTTYTTQSGLFVISGGAITFWWNFTLGTVSTATATRAFQINCPIATSYMVASVSGSTGTCGVARFYDDSGGLQTTGQMTYYTTDLFQMKSLANDTSVGVTPNITLANGDRWGGQITVPIA